MNRLTAKNGYITIKLGSDPEFFIFKGKKFMPYSKVFKENKHLMEEGAWNERTDKLVKDGCSVEFQPLPRTCRQLIGDSIQRMMRHIKEKLPEGHILSTKNFIKLTKKDLETLDEESINFGCNPSNNVYIGKDLRIEEEPFVYPYRAAGGHLHLGYLEYGATRAVNNLKDHTKELVKLLDLLVGNTMVLLDKSPENKKRRETYGRAGEYRDTKYGIEYRTLSNFWLRSYALMSLTYALARVAIRIVAHSNKIRLSHMKSLLSLVPEEDVINAINNNDYKLALQNFNKIKQWLIDYAPAQDFNSSIPNIEETVAVIEMLAKVKPEKYLPKGDFLEYWTNIYKGYIHSDGWDKYVEKVKTYNRVYLMN